MKVDFKGLFRDLLQMVVCGALGAAYSLGTHAPPDQGWFVGCFAAVVWDLKQHWYRRRYKAIIEIEELS